MTPTDKAAGLVERPDAAIYQLRNHQEQLDPDGVMVGVSRQALDETLDYIERLTKPEPDVVEWVRTIIEDWERRRSMVLTPMGRQAFIERHAALAAKPSASPVSGDGLDWTPTGALGLPMWQYQLRAVCATLETFDGSMSGHFRKSVVDLLGSLQDALANRNPETDGWSGLTTDEKKARLNAAKIERMTETDTGEQS